MCFFIVFGLFVFWLFLMWTAVYYYDEIGGFQSKLDPLAVFKWFFRKFKKKLIYDESEQQEDR